jgi:hypothetical protein
MFISNFVCVCVCVCVCVRTRARVCAHTHERTRFSSCTTISYKTCNWHIDIENQHKLYCVLKCRKGGYYKHSRCYIQPSLPNNHS